jgi:hypothetical protein
MSSHLLLRLIAQAAPALDNTLLIFLAIFTSPKVSSR